MRRGGGKTKGSAYEREVGNQISLWLSHGTRKDLLCRTVGSGAQFTSAARRGNMAGKPGDLMAQDGAAFGFCEKFVVEVKHWKDLELIRFMFRQGELYDAMLKVVKEANGATPPKFWWLVAKQNNRPALLFMSYAALSEVVPMRIERHALFNDMIAVMFRFDEFLKAVVPEEFLNYGN